MALNVLLKENSHVFLCFDFWSACFEIFIFFDW